MESILANRKRELGISLDSGRSLGRELAFHHGIDFGRGQLSDCKVTANHIAIVAGLLIQQRPEGH